MTISMHDAVETIARQAGGIALEHFGRLATLPVAMKGHLDLVTEADREVERFIIEALRRHFPEDGVLGEEGGEQVSASGRVWVVDPIDGTSNFVRGGDDWAVSIGLYENARAAFGIIHAPVRRQTFRGGPGHPATLNGAALPPAPPLDRARAKVGISLHPAVPVDERLAIIRHVLAEARMDLRSTNASTIGLMEMATGLADGHFGDGVASWDVMAALPILESLGFANTIDWATTPLTAKLRFACGTPDFLGLMSPILQRSVG